MSIAVSITGRVPSNEFTNLCGIFTVANRKITHSQSENLGDSKQLTVILEVGTNDDVSNLRTELSGIRAQLPTGAFLSARTLGSKGRDLWQISREACRQSELKIEELRERDRENNPLLFIDS